jgi:integrase/recombinase XerC
MKATSSVRVVVLPDPIADPWPVLWRSFERGLRAGSAVKGGQPASPRTLEIYRDGGDLFQAFEVERGWPTAPAAIQKSHVEEFLIYLRVERNAMPATVRARFSALRRFFNWCVEEGEIEHSPMQRMQGPRVDEPPPPVLTEDEQRAILGTCKGKDFESRRDMALLLLMLDSGIRRGEAAGIKFDDLDIDAGQVSIVGKGNKAGTAYFGDMTAQALDRYLRVRSDHPHKKLPMLFLAQRGPLTGDSIHHLIGRRARLAGISRNVHPHITRHSWTDSMKRRGASDEDVMRLGRWKDPKIMRRYGSGAAQARARETARRLSPMDRL